MTENNAFCWSEKLGSETSFQQKKYRVFNTQLTQEEYAKIKIPNHKLEFDKNESFGTRYATAFKKMWGSLSKEQKQEYFDIPHFSWEGFTFITGIEKTMTGKTVTVTIDGKEYMAIVQ